MKRIYALAALVLVLFAPGSGQCQSIHASAGADFLTSKFETSYGANVAVGYGTEKFIGGANFDIFEFGRYKRKYVIIAADARYFLDPITQSLTPFIAVQPGWVAYSPSVYAGSAKGKFAFSVMGGLQLKGPDQLVLGMISIGYSNISFSVNDETSHYSGLKIILSIGI